METNVGRVDVIVPVYNVAKYLARCLDSLRAQTFTFWRAICIDDGSTDGSARILDEYAASDSRFMVAHVAHGGVSKARNLALDMAQAEFVMFMDSDDLIHPQTLELALGLADRDGSDIVAWYREGRYRMQVWAYSRLGLDPVAARPWGYRKKYSLDKVMSVFTDNLLAHCTELSHSDVRWPVKHFYIWRQLIRRKCIEGIRFIEGLNFEDFPWWSEVIIKDVTATITRLPLYYRYPNVSSIVRSSKEEEKIIHFARGLRFISDMYRERASSSRRAVWSRNCKWPVIILRIANNLDRIENERRRKVIRRLLADLWRRGVFDDCQTKEQFAARMLIARFIGAVPAV